MKAACSGPVGKGITIVIEVKGKFNTALCYTPVLDGKAEEQIRLVCDEEAFRDSKIRIMPDVHAGKGCTIGTTMTITDKVVPGMVGVDIGCGMETVRIAQREIDSEKLDALIRSAIPCGREVRRASHEYCSSIDLSALRCAPYVNLERAKKASARWAAATILSRRIVPIRAIFISSFIPAAAIWALRSPITIRNRAEWHCGAAHATRSGSSSKRSSRRDAFRRSSPQ